MPDETSSAPTGAPAAAAPVTQPAGGVAAPPVAPAGGWASGFADPELRATVDSKKWSGPEELTRSYVELEKAFGTPLDRRINLPAKADDKAGWDAVFTKLGTPASPDGYGLKPAEGGDPEFTKSIAGILHAGRLTTQQALAVTQGYNALVEARGKADAAQEAAAVQADERTLRTEWGATYDQAITVARGSAQALGVEKEAIDAMQKAWGFAKTMKFFKGLGERMGEDKFITGAPNNGTGMTPEAARVAIKSLRKDAVWSEAYMKGDTEAKQKLEHLIRVAESDNPMNEL